MTTQSASGVLDPHDISLVIREIIDDLDLKVTKEKNTRKNHGRTCTYLLADQLIKKGLIK